MRFLVEGQRVEGEFLGEGQGDEAGTVLVKDKEGVVWRVPKGKIGLFTYVDSKEETAIFVPFLVLRCSITQPSTKCSGVQFIKEGSGFKRSDFGLFMDDCPCKDETCRFGSAGELRSVDGNLLRVMLSDTRFGQYPEKKGKANASRAAGRKAKRSESEGTTTGGGGEQAGGGTDQRKETP
jgi:hypothetical protein